MKKRMNEEYTLDTDNRAASIGFALDDQQLACRRVEA